jgi:branched-chain amino acid transport system ATP-binding protein
MPQPADIRQAPSASDPLLSVDGLVVRYGPITALNGVSLSIGAGETVAIVGPNGAGKSSLVGAISGTVKASAGSIRFRNESVLGQNLERTVRRGIAMVPEGRHVLAGLTVHENLRLGATVRTDQAEVAAEIDEFFRIFPILAERRKEAAGRLSGGEQQMLVIARALLSRPALLMLDEPSLGLAPKVTDRVYEILADVRRRGVSILVVEQNAARALEAADRTYVLNGGIFRISGTTAELAGNPDFEAAYFGLKARGSK